MPDNVEWNHFWFIARRLMNFPVTREALCRTDCQQIRNNCLTIVTMAALQRDEHERALVTRFVTLNERNFNQSQRRNK